MRRVVDCLLTLGLLLASSEYVGSVPSPPSPVSAAAIEPQANFTLVGDAFSGWGFSNATVTKPGPTLLFNLGDFVSLTLTGRDTGPQHNWFIDYNNDSQPDSGERPSPYFNGLGDPKTVRFSFVADLSGNWTYRCGVHPGSMWGMVSVASKGRPLNATLIGSSLLGWGTPNATISSPGPEIIVGVGALVTFTLLADANDTNDRHNWFIDYNNNTSPDPDENISRNFNGQGDPKTDVFSFNATRPGSYTYRCEFHPTRMFGSIVILGQAAPPPSGLGLGIVQRVLLGALAGVLVFAVVYEVRARRASRRRP